MSTLFWLAVAGAVAASTPASAVNAAKPNVIFILSDDLGYADNKVSADVLPANDKPSRRIPTPNMERMAAGGMKFVRGYSGQVCAPSRTTLMLGKHLGHTTIRGNDGAYTPLLATDITVAKVLKTAGYRTGLVGKWGLGNFGTTGYPTNQSFDTFVGQDTQVGCHDWYPQTVCNNSVHNAALNTPAELDYTTCLGPDSKCTWANDLDKTAALEFIAEAKVDPAPFMLYLASTTPHAGFLTGTGAKPAWFVVDYPVPYAYSQRFLNMTGGTPPAVWTNEQRQFASAVWAQDSMIGAVLDQLELDGIAKQTLVFFSGDNGPDGHNFELFDDPGIFRGKKRSLHEGGIRQTILAYWPGTIAAGVTSNAIFAFWDFLPTVAELAGVPESEVAFSDGTSAASVLRGGDPAAPGERFLYYEFCDNNHVDGLLPQVYAPGWVQAVRWDDNATAFATEWKAIISNSNASAMLLYNLTADPTESGSMLPGPGLDTGAAAGSVPAAAARARDIMLAIMRSSHVENPYWKSSQNASDKCCASCFTPGGCKPPCKYFGPHPPPPTPGPLPVADLVGDWTVTDGGGANRTFTLAVSSGAKMSVTLTNTDDGSSCWKTATGHLSNNNRQIVVQATGPACAVQATGDVEVARKTVVVDVDYRYLVDTLSIRWKVSKNGKFGSWPVWTRTAAPMIAM